MLLALLKCFDIIFIIIFRGSFYFRRILLHNERHIPDT